jgi:hypothetical protein
MFYNIVTWCVYGAMTLSTMKLSFMTLSIMTITITTLSITTKMHQQIDNQHNDISIMLGVVYAEYQAFCYAECHYAERCYAECHYAECHYAVCHYAECCGAIFMTSYLYHPSLIFARGRRLSFTTL